MKTINHPSFTRLLNNIVNETPTKSRGTYNKADPTCFEGGEQRFEYKGKKFLFKYNDCTWGIEITIFKITPKFPDYREETREHPLPDYCFIEKEIAGFYINREQKWDKDKERWIHYEEVILRQEGLKGMPGLLGRVFRQCLAPDFVSMKEIQEEGRDSPYLMKEYV